jgi:hypothetical protein
MTSVVACLLTSLSPYTLPFLHSSHHQLAYTVGHLVPCSTFCLNVTFVFMSDTHFIIRAYYTALKVVTAAMCLTLWRLLPPLGFSSQFNLYCFYVALTSLTFVLQKHLCYDFTCAVIQLILGIDMAWHSLTMLTFRRQI